MSQPMLMDRFNCGFPKWLAISVVLMFLGIVVLLGGFAYDFAFAGIPYQHPPPELQAEYDMHAETAFKIRLLGGLIATLGFVLVTILFKFLLFAGWYFSEPSQSELLARATAKRMNKSVDLPWMDPSEST